MWERQGNSRAQRHDQRAHRHDQGASGLHSTSQEDFRQRRCSGANTAGSTATHVCGRSGQGEILLSAKVTGKQPVQCLYGSQNTICCQSTWQAKRCGYASATNAWSSCGGSTNLASLCSTTIATLERSREQTTWPSGAESQQTTSRMESLRETRHLPKGAHAGGHSRLMCGTRRHGLHVPSSGRTHGCHRQRAKYSRSQKGNCRGRTTPHETHARRSGCLGLLANPGNPNHAGRVGPLRGSAQAHSRSATMDAVGKDHNGTRRRIGPSGIRHGGACPSDALGEGKWLPRDILADRPSYVLGFRTASEQNQRLCTTLGEAANDGVPENVHARNDTGTANGDFSPSRTLLSHDGAPTGGCQKGAHWVGQAARHRGKAVDVERISWTWTGSTHSLAESPQHEELQQHMGDPSLPILVCRCADRRHCRQMGCPNMGNRRTKRAAKDRYCKPAWSRGPHQTNTHTGVRIPGRFRLRYHVGSRGGRTCLSLRQGPSPFLPTPRQHVHNQAGVRHYRNRGANGMAGAQAGVYRHQSKPTNLEAVRVAQTPTSNGKSWTPREATSSHTGGRRPRDYLFARRRGGQPRHGVRTMMLTVRAVALLRPRTCTSRYKQPPCYASRTRPPRGKSSGFLLCMLCLLPRCSNHRQCCHTSALSARKCPPTELTREDAMRTARARSPEMMLPLPGLSPPRTCDCRLDCLFLMTGTMFYSMGRSHKRRRSDSSSEEGERQHRRRHTHTHIHVHVHQPQQRHPDRSKRRSAHRERCRIQGETRRMESALREVDAQQATEDQAARDDQQSAAQYSDRAPLIPFQANLPRHRPRTPSYEQVMARPPLPSYDEVVGMAADEEEAEHGPSRSGLANPYSLQQLRDISTAVQMQPERPTVITDVLYKTGSYIALALEPHLALHHRNDWVRDWATDVGHQLGFDDAPEPDTVKQGTHAAPRNWRLRLRGRKPQGLTFGISSNAKYGVSQYA